jgi:glycosyltransferase involved in cell wall biosynthesis
MRVSIIIPVYNVSLYISRCLNSILEQDFDDLECLLVDDASPDNSMALVEARLADYKGPICFRLLHHTENKGLSAARNTGILESTGEYVYFIDGDDALLPHSITRLAELAVIHNFPDVVQGSSIIQEGNHLNKRYLIQKSVPSYCRNKQWIQRQMLRRKKIPVTAWNKLLKKSFLTENQLFYKEGLWHEDEHWTFFAASLVQSIAFCYVPTYQHYIHAGSIMSTSGKRSVDSWFVILEDFILRSDLKKRQERKTILELLFCQLQRILKGDQCLQEENINRLRLLVKPCLYSAYKRFQPIETALLWCYSMPLPLLKFQGASISKALYFRILRFFV